jgi:hypothetical protein
MYPAMKAFRMNGEAIRLLTSPRFWRLVISATMMVLTAKSVIGWRVTSEGGHTQTETSVTDGEEHLA